MAKPQVAGPPDGYIDEAASAPPDGFAFSEAPPDGFADAKPGPYITKLSAKESPKFMAWVKANNVPYDPSPNADYDMPGFWKAQLAGDEAAKSGINQNDGKLHFTDKFKTPRHKSFSNESIYATPAAPHWDGDRLVDKDGNVVFDEAPSKMRQAAEAATAAVRAASPRLPSAPKTVAEVPGAVADALAAPVEGLEQAGGKVKGSVRKINEQFTEDEAKHIAMMKAPEAYKALEQGLNVARGTMEGTAIELAPFTPGDFAQLAAAEIGIPILAKGVAEYFPKTAEILGKERAVTLSPEAKGKLNYFWSELKQKLGIPQERGMVPSDVQEAFKKGHITPAQAARLDEGIKQTLIAERSKGMANDGRVAKADLPPDGFVEARPPVVPTETPPDGFAEAAPQPVVGQPPVVAQAETPQVVSPETTPGNPQIAWIKRVLEGTADAPVRDLYETVQKQIDGKVDELMKAGKSFEEADNHPDVEKLYAMRDQIGQKELLQSHGEVKSVIKSVGVPEDVALKILKNVYSLDPTAATGQALAARFTQRTVADRNGTLDQIKRILVNQENSRGVTPETLITNPASPLTDEGRRKLAAQIKEQAESIEDEVYNYFNRSASQATGELNSPVRELDATATIRAGARIQPAPITGQKPKQLNQIMLDVTKALGRKVSYGRASSPRAGGTYYPGTAATVVRFTNDLDTTAHELAHSLDDRLGIVARWNQHGMISPFDQELEQFWQHGSVQPTGPKADLTYKRAEGVAEFIRAWLVNPDAAKSAAPNFYAYLQAKLPQAARAALAEFSNDIRTFAGATAREKIMANVNWEPPKGGFSEFFAGNRVKPGPGFHLTWADKLQSVLQDDMAAFNRAVDFVRHERETGAMLPKDDPRVLARLILGEHAKMDDIFENGMVDTHGKRVTPGGIKWLMEPLDKSSMKALDRDVKDVTNLMIAQRTIEKSVQLRRQRVTGIGAGLEADAMVASKAIRELKANQARYAKLEEAAKRYRTMADAGLKYLRDSGRMSSQMYETIKSQNEYYVAMQRLMETAPGEDIQVFSKSGGKLGNVKQPIQKFKGSTRTIENPFTSLMENLYKAVYESDRNRVLQAFRKLLVSERGMHQGKVMDLASVGRRAMSSTDKNTIPIFINGQKELWQFQEDVYKALKGMVGGHYILPDLITALPRLLRSGVVYDPRFAVRNIIRDIQHRVVVTENHSKMLDSFKRYGPMEISALKLHGGDQSGHYLRNRVDYMRAMTTAMEEISKSKKSILVSPGRMLRAYENLMELSERQGRMAEYRRAFNFAKNVKKMDDENAHLYAAVQTRDLLDFAVAGSWLRVLNQMVPFTNAGVQGLTKTLRSAKANPKSFIPKWLLNVMLPTVAVWAYNQAKNKKEYNELPGYQKDLFHNVKVGDNLWLHIPKPYEIGVLASGVTRALDYLNGDKRAFDGYGGSLAKSLLPVDQSAIAIGFPGIVQVLANYDFWRGRAIVPHHEERLDLDLRNTQNASRLGLGIQKAIGVDARNVDFLMREVFGNIGASVARLSNVGRESKRGIGLSELGVFSGSPAYAARDVQWVMNAASRRGLTTRPDYKVMMTKLGKYFDAPVDASKDKAAQELLTFADSLRTRWENNPNILPNKRYHAKLAAKQKKQTKSR